MDRVVPGIEAIRRRRKLMEDPSVLAGEPDEATKPWREISVDGVKDNEKVTDEEPDKKPHLRRERSY